MFNMRRRNVRVVAVAISVMLALGLVATSVLSYYGTQVPISSSPRNEVDSIVAQVERLENQLENDPENYSLLQNLGYYYYLLGNYYLEAGDTDKSVNYFSEVVEPLTSVIAEHPEDNDSRALIATAQYYSGNLQQALTTFAEAVEIEPENVGLLYNYSLALVGVGEMDLAIEKWQAILELEESYPGWSVYDEVRNRLKENNQLEN